MCGISGIFGTNWSPHQLQKMVEVQNHRGPDGYATYVDKRSLAGLGHNRLSIIDLSTAGNQPMCSADGRYWVVFNGEIYNYIELKAELSEYPYQSQTDTEVLLAAYDKWGPACLDRFIGMFAFLLWDTQEEKLFAARDRIGVKPLNYHIDPTGTLFVSSEIKAIHASGIPAIMNPRAWATYLKSGLYDHDEDTFWEGIHKLPPGHWLEWQRDNLTLHEWYNLADRVNAEFDDTPLEDVQARYTHLMQESVTLRFRSDVPVGINLSGGLDSSTLLGVVQSIQGEESDVKAFTFVTGDPNYDELPWVQQMLAHTHHPLVACELKAIDVPTLAASVQYHQDEPFGGLPTLAYARLFEIARENGVIVLLDGQGMDEQWAGYDYYTHTNQRTQIIQGAKSRTFRPECLQPDFLVLSDIVQFPQRFSDVRDLQYRDIRYTKIPRALRFNDRVSMRSSTELREPFLDHRMIELAFRQPPDRKIRNGVNKWLLRQIAAQSLPTTITDAPKRPLQTPQREWLRGSLQSWANDYIHLAVERFPTWFVASEVISEWQAYSQGEGDNSFFIWQWISLGLMSEIYGVTA